MRELERRVLLSVLDRKWREHLYEMDYLREGIYLRAYSQRDPLVEYQREGFDMFAAMMDGIKEEAVGFLFNLEVSVEDEDGDGEIDEDEIEIEEPLRRVFTEDIVPDEPVIESGPAEEPNEELESPAAAFVRSPQIRAKGLQPQRQPQKLSYSAPDRGRRGRGPRCHGERRGRRVLQRRPQRQVPLRLRQEVQDVPRPPRRSDRPHRARRGRLIHRSAVSGP